MACFTHLGFVDESVDAACLSHDGGTLYIADGADIYTYDFPSLSSNGLLFTAANPVFRFSMAITDDDDLFWWEDVSPPVLKRRTSGGSVSTVYTDTGPTTLEYGMVWHPVDQHLWTHTRGELWEQDPGGSFTPNVNVVDADGANSARPAPTSDGGLYWATPVITPDLIRRFDIGSDTYTDSGTLSSLPFNELLPVSDEVWYPRDGAGRKMGAALSESLEPCADALPFFTFLYTASWSPVAYLDGSDVYRRTSAARWALGKTI